MTPYHHLFLFLFLLFSSQTATAQESYFTLLSSHPGCHPFDCGNGQTIGYPFWLADGDTTSEYCGYEGLGVTCKNNIPVLSPSSNATFNVLNISYFNNTIEVIFPDLYGRTTCPQPRLNLTIGTLPPPLHLTQNDTVLAFLFNCSSSTDKGESLALACPGSDFGTRPSYVFRDGEVPLGLECEERAEMLVLESAIDDEGGHRNLSGVLRQGFQLGWDPTPDDNCRWCETSGGLCGRRNETGNGFVCYCTGGASTGIRCSGGGNNVGRKILFAVTLALGSILLATLLYLIYQCARRWIRSKIIQNVEVFLENYRSLVTKRYKYSDLKKMTNSFKDELGQGGCGFVYKGKLEDGRQVAVKVLSDSRGNGEEFINEVASIGRTYHVNIVTLLGFCYEGSKRALVYEFMPNGSLERFIYIDKPRTTPVLGWEKLYNIALGIARGLEYLHRGCTTPILHFDIKPHNILLDKDFNPKISDFGLAKLCPVRDSIVSIPGTRGTIGYIAPEIFSRYFGGISSKSDVYSYGMMVLEMVGGRKNVDAEADNTSEIYYPHWIYEHLNLDGDLQSCGITIDGEEEVVRKMILVGLWCIQTLPSDRPSMNRVVDMLEGSIADLQMPPKPCLFSPPISWHGSSSTPPSQTYSTEDPSKEVKCYSSRLTETEI